MEYPIPEDTSVTVAVVQAVSDAEDTEPTALPPLGSVLDPEALDALFDVTGDRTTDRHGTVSFTYSESELTIVDGDTVEVEPQLTV
jgi:hypothetical protein